MTSPTASNHRYRPWTVRTVMVRLSRKLSATCRIRSGRLQSRLLAALLAAFSTPVQALPEGANVVAGQASVSRPTANAMVVNQASHKAVLDWQSFSIGTGQSVQFVQPGASSVALNRVVGQQASSIFGALSANGQVFLINPAGVMFAPGAQVNVGGLVASSLALSNEDFVAGRYSFSGNSGSGSVVNHGSINAARGGYVLLAAPRVSNTGTINTELGSAGLVAGERVSLDHSGAGLVRFSVDAAAVNAVAANGGRITADGGRVAVLASSLGDAMATVINQTGVIRASSAVERNGMVVLSGGPAGVVRVAGALEATGTAPGQAGGTVQVLGDKVELASGAAINTSGHAGGGTVLVGGDYQGKNAEVRNATRTHVAAGASIRADATQSGDGGKVIVWANQDTRAMGSFSARGGAARGNGGLVEVSGKQWLDFHGRIDVAAPQGMGGKVLFDPQDILLNTSNQAAPPNNANGTPDVPFANPPDPGTYTIQIADVTGYNELYLQASRDITLDNNLTMGAGNSVRFEANNNININAALTVTGAGALNLKADADGSGAGTLALDGALASQAGGITLSGASVTSTAAGDITATGASNANAGNVGITATGLVNLAGAITATGGMASTGNPGRAGGAVTISGAGVTTRSIRVSGSNGKGAGQSGGNAGTVNISSSAGVTSTTLTASGGDGGTGNSNGGNAGAVTVTSGGTLSLGATTADGGTGATTRGNVTLLAGGAISQTGALVAGTLSATTASAGGAAITLSNAGNDANTVNLQVRDGAPSAVGTSNLASAAIHYRGANAIDVAGINNGTGAGGNVTLTAGGAITQTGAIKAGVTTLTAGAANNITLNHAGNDFTGAVAVVSGNNVVLTDANAMALGASTVSGTLGVNTAGAITQTGALTVTGVTTLAAGSASDITLATATNNFSTVGISSGNNVSLRDTSAIVLGTSNASSSLSVTAGGAVAQTGAITAPALSVKTLRNGGADITLTEAGNDVTAVDLQARNTADTANAAGAISYTDANGFGIAAMSTTSNAFLSAGGTVSQTGAVAAAGLALTGTGGAYTLRHAGNVVTTLAANTGSIDYSQANALTVGTVGVAGVTTSGIAKIETTAAASNLTLSKAVVSGASGDAIVLKAGSSNAAGVSTGGRLINSAGASGIAAASGRYLVYSGDPATTTEGVSGYSKRYNSTAGFTPGGSANTFLYRIAPLLTITADNKTRVYGDANPTLTGVTAGLIDGDTASSVGVGYATTAVFKTPVSASPVAITASAANHENYTLVLNSGALAITPAPITSVTGITAGNKMADANTRATLHAGGAVFNGKVAGDALTVSTATGNFDTALPGTGKTVHITDIALGGVDAGNYRLIRTTASTTADITPYPFNDPETLNALGISLTGVTGLGGLELHRAAGLEAIEGSLKLRTAARRGLQFYVQTSQPFIRLSSTPQSHRPSPARHASSARSLWP